MSYNEKPLNLSQIVNSAHFSIYGFADPDEFSIHSISVGYFDNPSKLNSIGLTFSSLRYPKKHNNLVISSADAKIEQQQNGMSIIHDLRSPSEGQLFNFDTHMFQYYHLSEAERILAGTPSVWEGTLPIGNVDFSTKVRSWSSAHKLSLFLLKAGKTILSGQAYGPSYDELLRLLQSLQIMNHRDDLLELYQHKLDQETKGFS